MRYPNGVWGVGCGARGPELNGVRLGYSCSRPAFGFWGMELGVWRVQEDLGVDGPGDYPLRLPLSRSLSLSLSSTLFSLSLSLSSSLALALSRARTLSLSLFSFSRLRLQDPPFSQGFRRNGGMQWSPASVPLHPSCVWRLGCGVWGVDGSGGRGFRRTLASMNAM